MHSTQPACRWIVSHWSSTQNYIHNHNSHATCERASQTQTSTKTRRLCDFLTACKHYASIYLHRVKTTGLTEQTRPRVQFKKTLDRIQSSPTDRPTAFNLSTEWLNTRHHINNQIDHRSRESPSPSATQNLASEKGNIANSPLDSTHCCSNSSPLFNRSTLSLLSLNQPCY